MTAYKFTKCSGCTNRLYSNPPFRLKGPIARRCRECSLDSDGVPTNIVPYRGWWAWPASTRAKFMELPGKTPAVAAMCENCPVHLQGEPWDHLRTAGGKRIVCHKITRRRGCANTIVRTKRIDLFMRHVRAAEMGIDPVLLTPEEVVA